MEEKNINTELSAQPEPNIVKAGLKNRPFSILLPLFTLFLGLAGGVVADRLMTPPQKTPSQEVAKPQTNLADLPISLKLLQNPAVYEWRGSVTGKVVAKDEHTLTLENEKGNKITVTDLLPSGIGTFKTMYFKYLKKTDSRPTVLTLKDIPLGTTLRGEFFVFKNFPNTPVGSQFTIEE